MALFGQQRDISLFRLINRELMGRIISQQCVLYKYNSTTTNTNMYGESTEGRTFSDPVILFALIETSQFENPVSDFGPDFKWQVTYRFLRDDLVDANINPEVGDVIMFQKGYWEIDNVSTAQFFVGKDPEYNYLDANNQNPYETDLGEFGYNVSVICKAHYVPNDRINIQPSRL
jgi:hypothetical protein